MKELTMEQAVVISAYTGMLMCDFVSLQEYIENKMGRSVMSHELALDDVRCEIREKTQSDFFDLIPSEVKEKAGM